MSALAIWTALKAFLGPILKALSDWRVLAVMGVIALLVSITHEMSRADKAEAALKAERTAYANEHAAFLSEKAHSAALEAARGQEHASAVQSLSDQERACSARVEAARKSATVIRQILTEPSHANLDPAEPELLSAGQLRAALGR